MSQNEIKNIKYYLLVTVIILLLLASLINLEINVQKRWDNYEQKVFAEYNINNISK